MLYFKLLTNAVTYMKSLDKCMCLTLYCADRPKPPNPSYAQTIQNRPVNSQFVGLSFTVITSFFYTSHLKLLI